MMVLGPWLPCLIPFNPRPSSTFQPRQPTSEPEAHPLQALSSRLRLATESPSWATWTQYGGAGGEAELLGFESLAITLRG